MARTKNTSRGGKKTNPGVTPASFPCRGHGSSGRGCGKGKKICEATPSTSQSERPGPVVQKTRSMCNRADAEI